MLSKVCVHSLPTYEIYWLTGNSTEIRRRRRRHFRSVHASDEAPHEGRGVHHTRGIRALAHQGSRDGFHVRCQWPTRSEQLQGWRGVHRECAQETGETTGYRNC